ncbi:hypothetical protein H4219_004477 [Mycoemilia scoparia]|uniref:UspA domain-containing protein n=1 Tax=Mycoemilia scoparia TaxID=417184 RepID=A0A9W8DRT9_9FUNG|nr:hypothetical protein H4219_004477 [Mycoemilia scoparia]
MDGQDDFNKKSNELNNGTSSEQEAASPQPQPEQVLSLDRRRRVGICFDGSEAAEFAFDWAFKNCISPYQDHVFFIYSFKEPWIDTHALRESISGKRLPTALDKVQTRVKELSKDLLDIGVTSHLVYSSSIGKKSLGRFVVETCYKSKLDTVVVWSVKDKNLAPEKGLDSADGGSKKLAKFLKLGRTKRRYLTSMSTYILNRVECPVVVVKSPKLNSASIADHQFNYGYYTANTSYSDMSSDRLKWTRSRERNSIAIALSGTRSRQESIALALARTRSRGR